MELLRTCVSIKVIQSIRIDDRALLTVDIEICVRTLESKPEPDMCTSSRVIGGVEKRVSASRLDLYRDEFSGVLIRSDKKKEKLTHVPNPPQKAGFKQRLVPRMCRMEGQNLLLGF